MEPVGVSAAASASPASLTVGPEHAIIIGSGLAPVTNRLLFRVWTVMSVNALAIRGAAASKVRAAAQRIANDMVVVLEEMHEATGQEALSWHLAGGLSGVSLFLSAAGAAFHDERYCSAADIALARAEEALADAEMSMGMFSGFAGIAWVGTLARRETRPSSDSTKHSDDAFTEIDGVLADYLDQTTGWVPFDLLDGIAGIAIYALERPNSQGAVRLLESCVARLRATATVTKRGIAWGVPQDSLHELIRATYPTGTFPLGVAHGLAGVVGALARIVGESPSVVAARPLLDEALAFLLANRLPAGSFGAFPRLAYADRPAGERSEVSWCWGDPGVASSLLVASEALRDERLRDIAIETMRPIAKLAPLAGALSDGCLCHGWAGIGNIFCRFYSVTREEAFAHAAQQWIGTLLESAIHQDCIGGLRFRIALPGAEVQMRSNAGVLMGAAGVGLALLSAVGEGDDWARAFVVAGGSA